MPQSDETFAKGTLKATLKLPFFLARCLGISTNSKLAAHRKCICVRNFTVVLIRHSETAATSLNTSKTFAKQAVSCCRAVHSHFCRDEPSLTSFTVYAAVRICNRSLGTVDADFDVLTDPVAVPTSQIGQASRSW